jgi:hypothetical protein
MPIKNSSWCYKYFLCTDEKQGKYTCKFCDEGLQASQIMFIKHNSLIQHADMFKKAHQVLSSTSSYESGSVEDTDDVRYIRRKFK